MSNQPARAGVWAQFFVAEPGTLVELPAGGRVDRYRVDAVEPRAGAALAVEAGGTVIRVEAPGPLPRLGRGFQAVGGVQHVLYTDAARRREPAATSAGARG